MKNKNHEIYRIAWGNYPSIRWALLMASGIVAGRFIPLSWQPLLMATLAGIVTTILLERLHRRRANPKIRELLLAFYMCTAVLFGAFWYTWNNQNEQDANSTALDLYEWEDLIFYGKVYDVMPRTSEKWHCNVAVDSALLPSGLMLRKIGNIRLIAYPAEVEALAAPSSSYLGDYWTFSARLYPLEHPTNPHEFDYKGYLKSINIDHQAGLNRIIKRRTITSQFSWLWLRKKVLEAIDEQYDEKVRPLAKALLIGEKSGLDFEEKKAFSRSGLSHIMAVSGLHVGFLVFPVWLLIPWFWNRTYGRYFVFMLMLFLLLCYAGVTQFSASVCRAAIMALLLTWAKLYKRSHQSLNLMAFAAIILLLLNPDRLFEIGFQLSFSAVTAIILLLPLIRQQFPEGWSYRWYGKLIGIIGVSLIVQVSLFPLLVSKFGEFSLIGPLLNALVIPVMSIALPAALFAVPVHYLLPVLAAGISSMFSLVLLWLSYIVELSSSFEWGWMAYYPEYPLLMLLFWLAAISTLALWWHRAVRWKWAGLTLSLLLSWQAMPIWNAITSAELRLAVFDVGQGDAALLRTPNGSHLLIDTGPWKENYSPSVSVLLPYFERNNIKRLDGVLLTHPHADHIGGMVPIMEKIEIDTIYNAGLRHDSEVYRSYMELASDKHIPVKSLRQGDRIVMDPSVSMNILLPRKIYSGMDENNASLVLLASYGDTKFMFTGDIEQEAEQQLIARYDTLLDVDFLKVAHHGSATSSAPAFLRITTPEWATVSLAYRNRFRHPVRETVSRLRKLSDNVAFTSLDGALQFESNGEKIIRLKQ